MRAERLIELMGAHHADSSLRADSAAKQYANVVNAILPAWWIIPHARLHEATPDDFVLRPC